MGRGVPLNESWENQAVRDAVKIIVQGGSYQRATQVTGVKYQTIRRCYVKYVLRAGLKEEYRLHPNLLDLTNYNSYNNKTQNGDTTFTQQEEAELIKCIRLCEGLFYGISNKECRMLAYQMVVNKDMKIPAGWLDGIASLHWLNSFDSKHKNFMKNLKRPDNKSLHIRIRKMKRDGIINTTFEKNIVSEFYDRLEEGLKKIPGSEKNNRVFCLDEAYVSIDVRKTENIRESHYDIYTVCCIICANATSLPPLIIKPCCDKAVGATEFTSPKGRLTPELFIEIIQYFLKNTNTTPANPSILIMDTDLCHLSGVALNTALESGVYLSTLHPHVNKLIQPLDGVIFDSFNKIYYDCLVSSQKYPSARFDVGKTINEAWVQAATSARIENAFKKCGIYPFDRDLISDIEYERCFLAQEGPACFECRVRDERPPLYTPDGVNNSADGAEVPAAGAETADAESSSHQNVEPSAANEKDIDMSKSPNNRHQEMDKLRRRLIRSIARMIKEKKTEDEVWYQMKEEFGTNCKTLWLRMRSLTLKKLKRLLDADDRIENVPPVARMSLTDWLLYDLVLVHEKIDVINRGSQKDSKVLQNLFSLVQRFEIEGRVGDDLAEAWTAATVAYNSKGHQCSPMLMQRRWYQIKELTRHKLYKFWFTYRGRATLLDQARADAPTPLERAISLRYPEIVTATFPTWAERIDMKLVIMPEEFEVKMRRQVHMKPSDEGVPDVVIVEKKIDTIVLDSDSDFGEEENSRESHAETDIQTPTIVQVKTEPEDIDDSIDITEHFVKPVDKFQQAIDHLEQEEDRILTYDQAESAITPQVEIETVMPYITSVIGADDPNIHTDNILNVEQNIAVHAENNSEIQMRDSRTNAQSKIAEDVDLEIIDDNSKQSIVIDDDDDVVNISRTTLDKEQDQPTVPDRNVKITARPTAEVINDGIEVIKATKSVTSSIVNILQETNEVMPIITSVAGGAQVQAKLEMNSDFSQDPEAIDEEPLENYEENIMHIAQETGISSMDLAREIVSETTFADDGIEFADDGIEEIDHNETYETPELPASEDPDVDDTLGAPAPKFDLKLLMNPVVYTTKLDNMSVYRGKSHTFAIRQKDLVDKIIIESKPVSDKAINVERIKADNLVLAEENIKNEVENIQEFKDDLYHNNVNDKTNVIDSKRVKLTSSLLQKPKNRSYHPIQLCKNPDFNMRLKRLTMGFFSHERNRVFLKTCKPMTIDLSKAFESKLVNGTMYLKSSDTIVKKEVEDKSNESTVTVQPTALPVKSFIENTEVDKILQDELQKRMLERNKTINLPNISVVRKINQQLLMAEVAPIMAQVEGQVVNLQELTVQDVIETVIQPGNSSDMNTNPLPLVPKHTNPQSQAPNTTNPPPLAKTNKSRGTVSLINTDRSKEITTQESILNLNTPILPMLQSETSTDPTNTEKQKPKTKINRDKPGWIKYMPKIDTIHRDQNLTLDTLFKILKTLDPTCVPDMPDNSKTKNNKSANSQKVPSQSIKKTKTSKESEINDITGDNSEVENDNKPKSKGRPKKYCCWARAKILKLTDDTSVRLPKHKCYKDRCKCCCRENLRLALIDNEIKILENMQNRDIVETIEQVVQQARDTHTQASDSVSNAVSQILNQQNTTQENTVSQNYPITTAAVSLHTNLAEHTATNSFNAEENTKLINHDLRSSSKSLDGENTIVLEDDDDNGNDITSPECESEPVVKAPVPNFRVYAGRSTRSESAIRKDSRCSSTQTLDSFGDMTSSAPPEEAPMAAPVLKPKESPILVPISSVLPVSSIRQPVTKVQPKPMIPVTTILNTQERSAININKRKRSKTCRDIAQKDRNNEPDEGSLGPCTCGPSVAQDNLTPTLVVDGSGECKRHTSRVSKETRIYLSRKHLSTTQRPFFVGKNKILLTNIKPQRLQKTMTPVLQVPEKIQQPSKASQEVSLDIPEGVQIIVLPDGSVTYVLEPDAQLEPEQLNIMPIILKAVSDEIGASGITLPVHDGSVPGSNILNSKDNKKPPSDKEVHKTDKPKCEALSSNKRNESNEEKGIKNILVQKEVVSSTKTVSNEKVAVTTDITEKCDKTSIQENENKNELAVAENNRSATPTRSGRNLLSDLMEMSGIVEEDVTHTQPDLATIPTTQMISTDQTEPRPLSPHHSISAKFDEKTYELNPVVSFTELKYACENDGLFFKLDLDTGVVVPINVCIQKTPETKPKVGATEVIDLTVESIPPQRGNETYKLTRVDNKKESRLRIQNSKVSYKSTEQQNSNNKISYKDSLYEMVQRKKAALMKKLSNMMKPNLSLLKDNKAQERSLEISKSLRYNSMTKARRKQDLKNITKSRMGEEVSTSIEMEDSNQSMHEEYLEDFSEESDDEPLAKVAKKMRETERQHNLQTESDKILHVSETRSDVTPTYEFTMETDVPNKETSIPETLSSDHNKEIEESSETVDSTRDVDNECMRDSDSMGIDDSIDFEAAIDAVELPVKSNSNLEFETTIHASEIPVRRNSDVERSKEVVPTQLMFSGPEVPHPILLSDAIAYKEDEEDDCILGV